MGQNTFGIVAASLLVTACGNAAKDPADAQQGAGEPIGSYRVDPETGEVRATLTDSTGTTITLEAGGTVDPVLPPPFVLPAGSKVLEVTRVERGGGGLVTIEFESDLPPAQVAAIYRDLAEVQDFGLTTDIPGADAMIVGGEKATARTTFSLRVEPAETGSRGELTVTTGLG